MNLYIKVSQKSWFFETKIFTFAQNPNTWFEMLQKELCKPKTKHEEHS